MKLLCILFSTIFSFVVNSQDLLRVGADYKIPLYHPNSVKVNGVEIPPLHTIRTQSVSSNISFGVVHKNRFSLYTGISYQYISQVVEEYLDSTKLPGISDKVYFSPALDAHSASHSLGIKLNAEYRLVQKGNFFYTLGLSPEIYISEFYRFLGYKSEKEEFYVGDPSYGINGYAGGTNHHQIMPFVNLSIENRFSFNLKDKMTLTAKISLGTNVHAEWAQFKRYVWLGAGLELGFWRKKKE